MAVDGSDIADAVFDSSSILQCDDPPSNETSHLDQTTPLVIESPASFQAFLTTSCHKSTPLAVKRLLEHSVTNCVDGSEDASWSSSLATPSMIEGLEHACSMGYQSAVAAATSTTSEDDARPAAITACCTNGTPVPFSSPSSCMPSKNGACPSSAEDILSSFMCTPPSHKHKKWAIPRKLHASSPAVRVPSADGRSSLDGLLVDESDGSGKALMGLDSCDQVLQESLPLDVAAGKTADIVGSGCTTSAACVVDWSLGSTSACHLRKRSASAADTASPAATSAAFSLLGSPAAQPALESTVLTQDSAMPENGSLMAMLAKRRRFRYPHSTSRAASAVRSTAGNRDPATCELPVPQQLLPPSCPKLLNEELQWGLKGLSSQLQLTEHLTKQDQAIGQLTSSMLGPANRSAVDENCVFSDSDDNSFQSPPSCTLLVQPGASSQQPVHHLLDESTAYSEYAACHDLPSATASDPALPARSLPARPAFNSDSKSGLCNRRISASALVVSPVHLELPGAGASSCPPVLAQAAVTAHNAAMSPRVRGGHLEDVSIIQADDVAGSQQSLDPTAAGSESTSGMLSNYYLPTAKIKVASFESQSVHGTRRDSDSNTSNAAHACDMSSMTGEARNDADACQALPELVRSDTMAGIMSPLKLCLQLSEATGKDGYASGLAADNVAEATGNGPKVAGQPLDVAVGAAVCRNDSLLPTHPRSLQVGQRLQVYDTGRAELADDSLPSMHNSAVAKLGHRARQPSASMSQPLNVPDRPDVGSCKVNDLSHTGAANAIEPPDLYAFTTAAGRHVAVSQSSLRRVKSLSESKSCLALPPDAAAVSKGVMPPALEGCPPGAPLHSDLFDETPETGPNSCPEVWITSGAHVPNSRDPESRTSVIQSPECYKVPGYSYQTSVDSENLNGDTKEDRPTWCPTLLPRLSGTAVQSCPHSAETVSSDNDQGSSVNSTDIMIPGDPSEVAPPHSTFSTASGKSIVISSDLLQRARVLLADNEGSNPSACTVKVTVPSGFTTASGRPVAPSNEALGKACMILQSCDQEVPGMAKTRAVPDLRSQLYSSDGQRYIQRDITVCPSAAKPHFKDKLVDVSPDRAAFNCHTFKTEAPYVHEPRGGPQTAGTGNTCQVALVSNGDMQCRGFSTASGRHIVVSNEAVRKAQSMLGGGVNDVSSELNMIVPEEGGATIVGTEKDVRVNTCFNTASGKLVNVSDDAIQRVQTLFRDGPTSPELQMATADDRPSAGKSMEATSKMPCGFETASGRHVTLSSVSLAKARAILADDVVLPGRPAGKTECKANRKTGFSFETASGKHVSVAHEALAEVQAAAGGSARSTAVTVAAAPADSMHLAGVRPSMVACSFQTAAGKMVTVSHDALDQVRTSFADSVAGHVDQQNEHKTADFRPGNSVPSAFETASGKHVGIACNSLVKARAMLSGVDNRVSRDKACGMRGNTGAEPQLMVDYASYLPEGVAATKTPALCSSPVGEPGTVRTSCDASAVAMGNWAHPAAARERVSPWPQSTSALLDTIGCGEHTSHGLYTSTPSEPNSSTMCIRGSGQSTPTPRPSVGFTGDKALLSSSGLRHASPHFSFGNKVFTPHTPRVKPRQMFPKSLPFTATSVGKPLALATVPRCNETAHHGRHAKKDDLAATNPKSFVACRTEPLKRSFRAAVGGGAPRSFAVAQVLSMGVTESVVCVTFSNAEEYVFSHSIGNTTDISPDEASSVIQQDSGLVGKREIFRYFLSIPGIDSKLVTESWMNNHYRWIIWKLASYERSFPLQFAGACVAIPEVIRQLKYRYEKEIHNCQRSCLKKILERDDDPKKRMVLVVTEVWHKSNKVGIRLGDGWYCITAELDKPLELIVKKKKLIKEGTKLCICNAELIGSTDGCDPLEVGDSVKLKIYANSTRRARWDCKLGFQRCCQPFTVPLCTLFADGGIAACVHAVIDRIYPMQFMEKSESGSITFRNAVAEDRAARIFLDRQRDLMDRIFQRVSKELDSQHASSTPRSTLLSRKSSIKVSHLTTGAEIFEAIETSGDPESLQQSLTEEQTEKLLDYQRHVSAKQAAAVQEKVKEVLQEQDLQTRNVTPLRRVRIVGSHGLDIDNQAYTLLTIWKPTADVDQVLHEGTPVRLYGVTASESRGRTSSVPAQLSTRRGSLLLPTTLGESLLQLIYEPREVLSVSELCRMTVPPKYEEVDISGVIISVQSPAVSLQTAVITDENFSFAVLKFWGGLEAMGYNHTVTVGRSLVVTSASWCTDARLHMPALTVTELSTIKEHRDCGAHMIPAGFVDEAVLRLEQVQQCGMPGYPNRSKRAIVGATKEQNSSTGCNMSSLSKVAQASELLTSSGISNRLSTPQLHERSASSSAQSYHYDSHTSTTVYTSPEATGPPPGLALDATAEADVASTCCNDSSDALPFSQMPDDILLQVDYLEQVSLMQSSTMSTEQADPGRSPACS